MWAFVITAAFSNRPLCARPVHARGRARAHSHVIVSEIRLDSASAWDQTRVLTCRELPSAIWPWQQLTVSTRELLMSITYLPDNQRGSTQQPVHTASWRWEKNSTLTAHHTSTRMFLLSYLILFWWVSFKMFTPALSVTHHWLLLPLLACLFCFVLANLKLFLLIFCSADYKRIVFRAKPIRLRPCAMSQFFPDSGEEPLCVLMHCKHSKIYIYFLQLEREPLGKLELLRCRNRFTQIQSCWCTTSCTLRTKWNISLHCAALCKFITFIDLLSSYNNA